MNAKEVAEMWGQSAAMRIDASRVRFVTHKSAAQVADPSITFNFSIGVAEFDVTVWESGFVEVITVDKNGKSISRNIENENSTDELLRILDAELDKLLKLETDW